MAQVIPIAEAQAGLARLLAEAADHEVYLGDDGSPAGVLVSVGVLDEYRSRIDSLESELAVLRERSMEDF